MKKDSQKLLFEDFMMAGIDIDGDIEIITESLKKKTGRLQVTIPVGVVDKPTGNGRLYEKAEIIKAFDRVKNEMKTGFIHGQHGRHPEMFFVEPDKISHLITEAWVDDKGIIWNKWLVANTINGGGSDLAEMFLAGAKLGVSIRGRGTEAKEGHTQFRGVPRIRNYDYGGTDTVALPSTGIMAGLDMPKTEDIPNTKIEIIENQKIIHACKNVLEAYECNKTKQAFNINDEVEIIKGKNKGKLFLILNYREDIDKYIIIDDVSKIYTADPEHLKLITPAVLKKQEERLEVKDMDKLDKLLEKLDAVAEKVGTLTEAKDEKLITKGEVVEGIKDEIEQLKDGIISTKEEIETELGTKIDELNANIELNKKLNKKQTAQLNGMSEKIDKLESSSTKQKGYTKELENIVEALRKYSNQAEKMIEELRNYAWKLEDLAEEELLQLKTTLGATEGLRTYTLKVEEVTEAVRKTALDTQKKLDEATETIAKLEEAQKPVNTTDKSIHNAVGHLIRSNPALVSMKEELYESKTLNEMRLRGIKYLGIMRINKTMHNISIESGLKHAGPIKGWL